MWKDGEVVQSIFADERNGTRAEGKIISVEVYHSRANVEVLQCLVHKVDPSINFTRINVRCLSKSF